MGAIKHLVTVSGEIVLKSRRSRPRFYRRLTRNIEDALRRGGVNDFTVRVEGAKILVNAQGSVSDILRRVFGVYRVDEVVEIGFEDLSDLVRKVAETVRDCVRGKRFAVRVRRSGTHPFTSLDVERAVGAELLPVSGGVDLRSPEVVVRVEVKGSKAFIVRRRVEGVSGLPLGVEGRALSLYSGGFDSPVATWFVARRGVETHFLHFFLGDTRATCLATKSMKVFTERWLSGVEPRAFFVDLADVVAAIRKEVKAPYRQVVLRAAMLEVADRIAARFGYDALVTGEILGQASSQTLLNLKAVEAVVNPGVPVFRPLLGMDKEEVIRKAEELGTASISARVGEPCSIAEGWVVTKAKVRELEEEFRKLPEGLIDECVRSVKVVDVLHAGECDGLPDSSLTINCVPEGSVLVDLRSPKASKEKPVEGAVRLEDLGDLSNLKGKVVVLFCESGVRSYLMAKELRGKGVRAFSFEGGYESLR
ncbi:MAG: tRNA 4-thiouridine(8) synthase ThiI, partial [Desulfurococcales archaeon]|nr:tRNA 4-thiouridine(8) synthase ThiI [Desulfurococcales archaeon]